MPLGVTSFPSFTDNKLIERIGIDKIIVIAFGNIGQFPTKQGSDVIVFTIVVHYIGNKLSLLQQVRTAGKIICPCFCLICPCFMAVEPLTKWPKTKTRNLIIYRLMNRSSESQSDLSHWPIPDQQ